MDALDERHDADGYWTDFISELLVLQQACRFNLFATSRAIPNITGRFEGSPRIPIHAYRDDVRIYLEAEMYRLRPVIRNPLLQEMVKDRIIEAIDGM